MSVTLECQKKARNWIGRGANFARIASRLKLQNFDKTETNHRPAVVSVTCRIKSQISGSLLVQDLRFEGSGDDSLL